MVFCGVDSCWIVIAYEDAMVNNCDLAHVSKKYGLGLRVCMSASTATANSFVVVVLVEEGNLLFRINSLFLMS